MFTEVLNQVRSRVNVFIDSYTSWLLFETNGESTQGTMFLLFHVFKKLQARATIIKGRNAHPPVTVTFPVSHSGCAIFTTSQARIWHIYMCMFTFLTTLCLGLKCTRWHQVTTLHRPHLSPRNVKNAALRRTEARWLSAEIPPKTFCCLSASSALCF